MPSFEQTRSNNFKHWKNFWRKGAAVDFSDCTDPRAMELERRIILSRYLTKIQCSGSLPPQETGLTYNSWHGKFHLEMHWWHAVHFALWGYPEVLEKQLQYYFDIYEPAKSTAIFQGYAGVRWPKMVGPAGRESPSTVGTFLIWQQPHLIYYTELLYQIRQDQKVLEKYQDLVFATADFMASYARFDSTDQRFVLGPPLIPAQENFAPETTLNPTFELAYWYWGLNTARLWKQRLNLPIPPRWEQVLTHLSKPAIQDSLYLFSEDRLESYTNQRYRSDHPMVTGAWGMLPLTPLIDKKIFELTFREVIANWNWKTTWGWDYPMLAMAATRLNQPEIALEMLLMDTQKNTYLVNGHNYQDQRLTLYLPGNGGLLTAVALMCAGSDADSIPPNAGFPKNGKWQVRWENFNRML